jgi:hypothetical protein
VSHVIKFPRLGGASRWMVLHNAVFMTPPYHHCVTSAHLWRPVSRKVSRASIYVFVDWGLSYRSFVSMSPRMDAQLTLDQHIGVRIPGGSQIESITY